MAIPGQSNSVIADGIPDNYQEWFAVRHGVYDTLFRERYKTDCVSSMDADVSNLDVLDEDVDQIGVVMDDLLEVVIASVFVVSTSISWAQIVYLKKFTDVTDMLFHSGKKDANVVKIHDKEKIFLE
ncbi:uncharacterized protein PHALS_05459 [Plasmopara halstedii]|uniref:Uncharacterized protein n=1 Tax=Plasmopara halstedii TaxID=4781 RepID=A0A0P1B015_PLAHL|nr:uncharacterized protein PHALS_05459 [Plasmopara halstedii]CEG47976.1 hypothetical protein PHALS_05459 [Plasmopara halstedii]|eukprot:XP_024584345.1 hypothetical protein PHALS_05459 [Plasmopara halstedii]